MTKEYVWVVSEAGRDGDYIEGVYRSRDSAVAAILELHPEAVPNGEAVEDCAAFGVLRSYGQQGTEDKATYWAHSYYALRHEVLW